MKRIMENYKELDVWQKAVDLVIEIYTLLKDFPQDERYGLITQIQRAVISVPANIAEGWGRGSTKEYIQFLRVSRGSLTELETHLIISGRLNYLPDKKCECLLQEIELIGKMLPNSNNRRFTWLR